MVLTPVLQQFRQPNPRVPFREIIEPSKFPISMARVEFRRLKGERIDIGRAAISLTRRLFGPRQQSRADPEFTMRLGDP